MEYFIKQGIESTQRGSSLSSHLSFVSIKTHIPTFSVCVWLIPLSNHSNTSSYSSYLLLLSSTGKLPLQSPFHFPTTQNQLQLSLILKSISIYIHFIIIFLHLAVSSIHILFLFLFVLVPYNHKITREDILVLLAPIVYFLWN